MFLHLQAGQQIPKTSTEEGCQLDVCADTTCREEWISCSCTEELPSDDQPKYRSSQDGRSQQLQNGDADCCPPLELGDFCVLLHTYIHICMHNSVLQTTEVKQIHWRDRVRKYHHQEFNRVKGMANALQQWECWRAWHWTRVTWVPLPHPAQPLPFSPLWLPGN